MCPRRAVLTMSSSSVGLAVPDKGKMGSSPGFSICRSSVWGFVSGQGFKYRYLQFQSCFPEEPAAPVASQWRSGPGVG